MFDRSSAGKLSESDPNNFIPHFLIVIVVIDFAILLSF